MDKTTMWVKKSAAIKLKAAMLKRRNTTRGITDEVSAAIEAKAKEILAEE